MASPFHHTKGSAHLGSDDSTSLSPRLRHLLIQEDRSTGKLYIPVASSNRPGSQGSPRPSPPGSPFAFPISPFGSAAELPRPPRPSSSSRFPHAISQPDRTLPDPLDRRSSSITALLSHDTPQPVLPIPTSFRDSRYESQHPFRASAPSITFLPNSGSAYSGITPAPLTCPVTSTSGRNSPFLPPPASSSRPSTGSSLSRMSTSRRHSGGPPDLSNHPYRFSPHPYPSPMTSNSLHASSSRAPISRTTKACNACRNRKVRCDAGGPGAPEGQACGRCRDAGVECIYSGVQKKRGPCPGSMRPSSSSQKARRPSSTRSSITSLAPVTPPEDSVLQPRNSYGFSYANPLNQSTSSNPFTSHHEQVATSLPPPRQVEQIHSWPGPPDSDLRLPEKRPVVFDEHYSMSMKDRAVPVERVTPPKRESVVLPPLKIAIGHKDNYYE